jgi:endonuclease/exonuclease/phosphatase family metal-dependent hydrolase
VKLLSYNIHIGAQPAGYGHYLTRAWRHALPGPGMHDTLDAIGDLMQGYDFVAIQEADAGSLRTRFVNQMEYLAKRAGFDHVDFAVNRDLSPVARHASGFLSRHKPSAVVKHRLPGRIPGRSALEVDLGPEAGDLSLLLTHLSLGHFDRHQQLDYLSGLVKPARPTVLLGDLNCEPDILRAHQALSGCGICVPEQTPATFPSWRPKLRLDHILGSTHVSIQRLEALPTLLSDHLALAAEITITPRTVP